MPKIKEIQEKAIRYHSQVVHSDNDYGKKTFNKLVNRLLLCLYIYKAGHSFASFECYKLTENTYVDGKCVRSTYIASPPRLYSICRHGRLSPTSAMSTEYVHALFKLSRRSVIYLSLFDRVG